MALLVLFDDSHLRVCKYLALQREAPDTVPARTAHPVILKVDDEIVHFVSSQAILVPMANPVAGWIHDLVTFRFEIEFCDAYATESD